MEIIKVALTSILSVAVLFGITKLIGHRQISQLDMFDYINGITIGSIAAELATELEKPLRPLIAMIVYGAFAITLSIVTERHQRTRKYINGTPTIIINNGKIYRENMKKAKLDLSDLMVMCRQAGYFDITQIQTAVFEYNGRMTFLPSSEARPLTPQDMNLHPKKEEIPTEIIMDGRVLDGNLQRMGLNIKWLNNELKAQGYASAKEIFLGICTADRCVTLYAMDADK